MQATSWASEREAHSGIEFSEEIRADTPVIWVMWEQVTWIFRKQQIGAHGSAA